MMAGIITVGLLIDLFAYGLLLDRGGRAIWLSLTVFGTAGALRTCPGLQRGTGRPATSKGFCTTHAPSSP